MIECVTRALVDIVGAANVLREDAISEDYCHDEALGVQPHRPDWLVRPSNTEQTARVLEVCNEHAIPVTARGSGTGLSGGCVARQGGVLLAFEHMKRIKEIDTQNHVAVVEPGVTLAELDDATAQHGLMYPIVPGELSGSIGGNVATNAGGMQAIKYGVTRHNVLGLEAVLPSGEVLRCGGKFVKASTGFDLTQLIIGSEGTLAIVTEITLRLRPRSTERSTLLLPFATLEAVTQAVPALVALGRDPLVLEYIDLLTMEGMIHNAGLTLGVPQAIRDQALAYLVVVVEGQSAERIAQDIEALGTRAVELGALDAFLLPPQAGSDLLHAREQTFWIAKKSGASEILDVVVPRAAMAEFMHEVSELGDVHKTLVVGCGHAGDGNVHLSVFQPDEEKRSALIAAILRAGMKLGGVISAEHGIGSSKLHYFVQLEDPHKLALMRRIKLAFDPNSILNPGALLG